MKVTIGCICGGLAVALIINSIWASTKGGGEGMTSLLIAFGLLLVAVGTLKPGESRV